VETTDSDISAYIPTNLISITDGQIYLDTARYERNQRPAVDIGRSVSRIGAVAQPEALRAAARNLRILISRFEAVESLTRVGLDVDPATERTIRRGRILREVLRQGRFRDRSVAEQVLTLTAVAKGWLDAAEPRPARAALERALARARAELEAAIHDLDSGKLPPEGWEDAFHAMLDAKAGETST
jgi:F-type H+-transporting ATPase subunit alpha